jgi:hypothetical protein
MVAGTSASKGRIWTYLDPIARQVVSDATPTHERDGPERMLAPFVGDLQADAYTGYDGLYRTGRIRELGCWAHARRGLVEALPTEARAAPMVALIQELYQVERAIAEETAEVRRARRHDESVPILQRIAAERDALAATVLPKSPLGDAVRYLTIPRRSSRPRSSRSTHPVTSYQRMSDSNWLCSERCRWSEARRRS